MEVVLDNAACTIMTNLSYLLEKRQIIQEAKIPLAFLSSDRLAIIERALSNTPHRFFFLKRLEKLFLSFFLLLSFTICFVH